MPAGVRVVGLDTFAQNLRIARGRDANRELARRYRMIARDVRETSRARARSKSASYAKAATGITSTARDSWASIRITEKKGRFPWIFGEEFGAYQSLERRVRWGDKGFRTVEGWNQFPPWRGNQWTQGVGPDSGVGYAVYPTIRQYTPKLVDLIEDAMDDALAVAFPEKR